MGSMHSPEESMMGLMLAVSPFARRPTVEKENRLFKHTHAQKQQIGALPRQNGAIWG